MYIQRSLGISLGDLARRYDRRAIEVEPIFGDVKNDNEKYSGDVFVIMPFSEGMQPIYKDHIEPCVNQAGLTCYRADDIFTPTEIMNDIWNCIYRSRILIADCTGKNPNVFYELGISHTLGKKVIIISQKEEDIPFDLRHRRFFIYSYTPRGMAKLEGSLLKALNDLVEEEGLRSQKTQK